MIVRAGGVILASILVAAGCAGAPDPRRASGFTIPEVDLSSLQGAERQKAEAELERARSAPEDAEAIGVLGMRYFAHDFPLASAACLERAVELAPGSLKWRYYLGLAHERAADVDAAIRALEGAVLADDSFAPARVKLAGLLVEKDPGRAERLFREAIERDPRDAAAHLGLGQCARLAGRRDEALEHFRRALEILPDYAGAHYGIAMLLAASGREEEAREHLARHASGVEPAPDPLRLELLQKGESSFAMRRDAAKLAERGALDEAERLLERSIDTDFSGATSHKHLGVVLAKQGRFAEAAEQFRLALEADPDDVRAMSQLGLALTELKQYDEAIRLYRDVLERHPDDASTHVYLGRLLAAMGRTEEALDHLRQGVRAQPSNGLFQLTLGETLAAAGLDSEAATHLRKAVDLQPDHPRARYTLGVVLARSGDPEAAAREWEEVIRIDPRFPEAYLGLAGAALERSDPESAVRWAEKACELTGYRRRLYLMTLAQAYDAAGRPQDAARARGKAQSAGG